MVVALKRHEPVNAFSLVVCLCLDGTDWLAFIIGEDETRRSVVKLCGVQDGRHFCINNLLVQEKYAAAVGDSQLGT